MRLGLQCARCCGNLMAVLLAVGVMDLRAMAAVTAAIAAERLTPAGGRVAHATGAIAVAAGLLLTARAAGLA
jgi:predicted metal-binding membrane protein